MAVSEACEIWVKEAIEEGIAEGKGQRELSREIAADIAKLFETTINTETIRTRIRTQMGESTHLGGRPTKLQEKRKKTPDNQMPQLKYQKKSEKPLDNQALEKALYYAERLSDAFSEVLLNNQSFQINTEQDMINFRFLRAYSPAIIRGFQYCDVDIEKAANITKIKPLEDLEEIELKLLEG